MKFNVRNLMLGLVAVASIGLTACGGHSCDDISSTACANDDKSNLSTSVALCKQLEADKDCGSKFKDALNCGFDNHSCDANGKSNDTTSACKTQEDAFEACCTSSATHCGFGG